MARVNFHIGTSGWNYDAWQGKFYPATLPKNQWLQYYQKTFNIVEINATFYRSFNKKVFLKWYQQAGPHFKYIIKVNRYITHIKYLKSVKTSINRFNRSVKPLADKLALILLQLPPRMPYDLKRLEQAILAFEDPKKVVVEFRDNKWHTPEVKTLLTRLGCIFCAANSPNMELVPWVTSYIAYVRLHGSKAWFNYKYTNYELHKIAKFINILKEKGAKDIYILFNNDYYAYAIQNALSLNNILKKMKTS